MKLSRIRLMAVSTTALVAMLGVDLHYASAQTLMDFFRDRRNREVQTEQQQAPAPARSRPAVAPRVSGPSYYTYKTDPLVRVDFAAIAPKRDSAALVPIGIDSVSVGSTQADETPSGDIQASEAEDVVTGSEAAASQPEDAARSLEDAVAEVLEQTVPEAGEAADDAGADGEETASGQPDPAEGEAAAAEEVEAKPAEQTRDGEPEVDAASTPDPSSGREEAASPAGDGSVSEPAAAEAEVEEEPVGIADQASARQPLTDTQIGALQDFELLAEKEAAEAIVAHYTAVPDFIWVTGDQPNDSARAALRVLADAASHGLNPADYTVAMPAGAGEAALAAFEMELSARLLRYVRDARSGRVDPNRISGYYDFEAKPLDLVATLQLVRDSDDVAAMLEAQHPQNERYKALRVELEMLRASTENEIVVAPKTLVRPGETNDEFPKILTLIDQKADDAFRNKFGALLAAHAGARTYDRELVPAIKAAQKAHGLGDDGVIGPRTVQALAGDSKAARIAKVEVALEQLRWLPSQFADRHVFINTPAFEAVYVEDGKENLSMRTVVGNNSTQTYFFQDEIEYVEFHPYWGVPRSILVNKYLPKLYSDPSYLDRNGFEVVNSRGQTVSSSSVNWGQYGAKIPYNVRQKPGRGNALGELKIMFPNRHAIYLHDTPEKHLFDRDNRALSNGCIRLQDPRGMAAAVLGWSREDVTARLDRPHSRENLSVKVPVYVTYFTAWADEAGKVSYYTDVYGRDDKMRDAIAKIEAVRNPGA